jgi:deoxyribodipyrimidine photo-lyase
MIHDTSCEYAWHAGLTGGRINKFNITKQSKDYDLSGKYIKHWLPELQNVPTAYVHEPWTMPLAMQRDIGCVIGSDYPQPVPAARMARPWQGHRYPDAKRNEQYGSRVRQGSGGGVGKGAANKGAQRRSGGGRAPINFY